MCCMKTSSTAKLYFTSSSILKHALLHSGFTSNCSQNHQDPLHHPRRPLGQLSHNQSGMEQPQPWVKGQNHRHRIRFLAGQVKVGVFLKGSSVHIHAKAAGYSMAYAVLSTLQYLIPQSVKC